MTHQLERLSNRFGFIRSCQSNAFKVAFNLVEVHHIGIFMVEIKKVDFVGQEAAVKAALLHHNGMEAV